MNIRRLLIPFVAATSLVAAVSAFAQIGGGQGFWANAEPTRDAQRQAARNAKNAKNARRVEERKNNAAIPKTRVVAFGVDKYSEEKNGLRALYGCANDADAVCRAFDYADSSLLTNEKATRDAIFKAINEAARDARHRRLIVYFACHGVNVCGRSFVCPFDAAATDENLSLLKELKDANKVVEEGKKYGLIPLADILSLLKNAKTTEVLVIFDACRKTQDSSDDSTKGDFMRELLDLGKKNDAFERRNQGAFAVLTSCSVEQSAAESFDDERDCGLFTRFLLEGITTGSADYAGLADGYVTLAEAYNYAYSKTALEAQKDAREQTPERYFSNVSNKFVLKVVEVPTPPENETQLQFLARVGRILTNLKWEPSDNQVGVEALDVVLENIPNDVVARGSRAAARRRLGDYVGAIDDYHKIGEKFQLYATRDQKAQDEEELDQGEAKGAAEPKSDDKGRDIREFDLLTIEKVEGDRYYVSEVNNKPLDRVGWIDAKNAGWSISMNGSNILTTTPTQEARSIASNGMITSGRNAVTGPRPFVGTLGF